MILAYSSSPLPPTQPNPTQPHPVYDLIVATIVYVCCNCRSTLSCQPQSDLYLHTLSWRLATSSIVAVYNMWLVRVQYVTSHPGSLPASDVFHGAGHRRHQWKFKATAQLGVHIVVLEVFPTDRVTSEASCGGTLSRACHRSYTYERAAIEKWMESNTRSPVEPDTALDRNKELVPNLTMKAHIKMFYKSANL